MTAQLCDRYRPRLMGEMIANPRARAVLAGLIVSPRPSAWLLRGPTGVGKTTAALALAHALSSPMDTIHAAGPDVTAEWTRSTWDTLELYPWVPGRWRLAIIDEADRISRQAQLLMLTYLEQIPCRAIIVMTSNLAADQFESRFLGRCKVMDFTSPTVEEIAQRVRYVAAKEGVSLNGEAERIAAGADGDVRSAMQALELELMARGMRVGKVA